MNLLPRRTFLRKGTAAALGTAVAATAATACSSESTSPAQQSRTDNTIYRWKMVTTWPPNFPILGEGCQLFADWVEKMSAGRMRIQVYGGGELAPALEAFDAVSYGAAEMGHGASYYWAGKIPSASFFTTVPFGMNGSQMTAWLQRGGGLELWRKVYEPFNLIPFMSGNSGMQMGGWFNKEINSLADVQGLKMRIPGLGAKVLAKAGGSAVLSAAGEIFTNLERGVIDASEWIGPYHDHRMGFQKVAKYYYYPGWHEPGSIFELFANKSKFESLPDDLQEIIRAGTRWFHVWATTEFDAKNAETLQRMIEEEGVQLRAFPQEVLDAFRRYTQEVLDELTASDPTSREVYASYQKFQRQMAVWSGVSEKMYYEKLETR
ncbi:TRAP transporter substrate-binding protein [Catalinimonas alkaloidigena]|nr:TRAP transporter substrate-binding protein [Catalinimonas alkaloidigena]